MFYKILHIYHLQLQINLWINKTYEWIQDRLRLLSFYTFIMKETETETSVKCYDKCLYADVKDSISGSAHSMYVAGDLCWSFCFLVAQVWEAGWSDLAEPTADPTLWTSHPAASSAGAHGRAAEQTECWHHWHHLCPGYQVRKIQTRLQRLHPLQMWSGET